MENLGFIGYGLRSETMMKAFRALECNINVSAIVDPNHAEISKGLVGDPVFKDTKYYTSADEMLKNHDFDGIFIGTRCSLHSSLASKVLEKNIPLFLEKPVCISSEQYFELKNAAKGKEHTTVVSFPLRVSPIVVEMKKIVGSGVLGKLTMVQAINNVPYGSVYYHSWYRDSSETGGLFLQKATHDLDYINFITGELPISVCAKTTNMHFNGDKNPNLECINCPEYFTCNESSYVVKNIMKDDVQGKMCCFTNPPANEDGASAIFTTKSGALISYNQNFVVKKGAGRRGARFIGTEASVEFDFYTSEIRVDRYFTPQTVTHKFNFAEGMHFGGDESLALDFMNVLNGENAQSDLNAGLQSAACCLAAKEAAEKGKFIPIIY